jgi:hypothetical protein
MIEQTFLSKRPVFVPKYSYTPSTPWYSEEEKRQAVLRGISAEEYVRRNKLVIEATRSCKLRVGDTGYPVNKTGMTKYGPAKVTALCWSYKDFELDHKWPEKDSPLFVVNAVSVRDPSQVFVCTADYLSSTNAFETQEEC